MRGQKGITLVALVITVVVLLILAVVAITAINETGIIDKSNQAATKYNQAQKDENDAISGWETMIDEQLKKNS